MPKMDGNNKRTRLSKILTFEQKPMVDMTFGGDNVSKTVPFSP